jgi:hypothetical protein
LGTGRYRNALINLDRIINPPSPHSFAFCAHEWGGQGGNAVVLKKTPSSHHGVILYAAVLQAK